MNNFYGKIWENTKDWKIEPFILLWSLFMLNIVPIMLVFYFLGLVIYFYNDKKFRGIYMKKFILRTVLTGVSFLALLAVIWFAALFILGFDDSGYFSSEDRDIIFMKIGAITIILKVFYCFITAKICQTQKKLAYEVKTEALK
jgi:fatty acid desaturase